MDHQFPASVARGLRRRNVDVVTAIEDGSERLPDDILLARASELSRMLVTHDKGILALAAEWQDSGREFAGIAFAAQQNMDIGKSIEYLELIAHVMPPEEMRNRVEYIPTG